MRPSFLLSLTLLLAACGTGSWPAPADLAQNPLYVYAEQSLLTQHLANVEIKDGQGSGSLAGQRQVSIRASQDAQAIIASGWSGMFVPAADEVSGAALLLDGTLFFGPDFMLPPGLDVHVYLSSAVDPREGVFPDETALDLGRLATPFGAQAIALPQGTPTDGTLRTVVLRDEALGRLMSFAQLSRSN